MLAECAATHRTQKKKRTFLLSTSSTTHTGTRRTSLLRGLFRMLLVGSATPADCLSFRSAASCGTTGVVASPALSPCRRSPSGDRATTAAGASASARAGFACFAFPPPRDGPRPPLPLPLDPPALSPLGIFVGAAWVVATAAAATAGSSCRSRAFPISCHPIEEVELSARRVSDFTTALVLLRPLLTVTMGGGLASLPLLACDTIRHDTTRHDTTGQDTRGQVRKSRRGSAGQASQGNQKWRRGQVRAALSRLGQKKEKHDEMR